VRKKKNNLFDRELSRGGGDRKIPTLHKCKQRNFHTGRLRESITGHLQVRRKKICSAPLSFDERGEDVPMERTARDQKGNRRGRIRVFPQVPKWQTAVFPSHRKKGGGKNKKKSRTEI